MGGAGEGGAVELWERRTDGGLGCGQKTNSEEWKSIWFERGESISSNYNFFFEREGKKS